MSLGYFVTYVPGRSLQSQEGITAYGAMPDTLSVPFLSARTFMM